MAKMALNNNLPGALLLCALIIVSSPLPGATTVITGINIFPLPEGDALLVAFDGDINSISVSIDKEKHAIVKIFQSRSDLNLKWKKRTGKLIKDVELKINKPSEVHITINFKRRLGRHSRSQIKKHGRNFIRFEFLDEVAEKRLKLSVKSVIQPVIERGFFELDGSIEKKPLDYNKDDRKRVGTEEFLALFGTQIKPRPNRITDFNYLLTDESLELRLALHNRPLFTLKSYRNPPGVELKLMKTLGDFEINHGKNRHNFLGNIITTRKNNNTLIMKANLYETAEISSKIIKNPHKSGYLFTIKIKRIYPWETEAAIPDIDIR